MAKNDDLAVDPLGINRIPERAKTFLRATICCVSRSCAGRTFPELLNHFIAPLNLGIEIIVVIRLLAHLSRPQHRIGLSGFK
jgi:hypothetical protein